MDSEQATRIKKSVDDVYNKLGWLPIIWFSIQLPMWLSFWALVDIARVLKEIAAK